MRLTAMPRILALAGACAVLSACGGASSASSSAGSGGSGGSGSGGAAIVGSTPTSGAASSATGGTGSGRVVFTQACAQCHSVSGHNKPSQQGGDLLHFSSTRAQLVQLTREMPIIHHRLSNAEVQAVVDYLRALEARG